MPFEFKRLEIEDVVLVTPGVFGDSRGFFMECYKESEFRANGITDIFVQDNHSCSSIGVIRGLHFQREPKAQGKLIRVVRGAVLDVPVDIRVGSPTRFKWVSAELSESNNRMLYIPSGFAHGFAALTDDVHLIYKCSNEYSPEFDAGIRWDDPEIAVDWGVKDPLVSVKDAKLPFVRDVVW